MWQSLILRQILQLCGNGFMRIIWFLCHYMLIDNHYESDKINLNGTEITSSNNKKLVGVLIDKKVSFDVHRKFICKKAG